MLFRSIFIVGNQVLCLGTLSGVCLENFTESVVIIPVTTFHSLTAPFASLIILTYLAIYTTHLLAKIALERKQLENIPRLLGKLKLWLTGPEIGNKPVSVGKSFSLVGI